MESDPASTLSDLARVRAAYDLVARDYADLLRHELDAVPVERALLHLFAEQVAAGGGGEVGDLGCGPGRIAGRLASLGLDVVGIDISPAMIEVARAEHPGLRFDVGDLAALPFSDGGLAAAVLWYSIIHTPPDRQPAVFAELARVVRPGGLVLLAFRVGDEIVHLTHAYGHDLDLDTRQQRPERIRARLARAGFAEVWLTVREPVPPERAPRACLLVRADR